MKNKISAEKMASWVINNTDRGSGNLITHLALQKVLYYIEAWFLANHDRALYEEKAEAWAHGPVYPSVYEKYKGSEWNALPAEKSVSINDEFSDIARRVLDEYSQFSAKKLEDMTHEERPWVETRGNLSPEARCDKPIDKLLIRNFYADRLGKKKIKTLKN